MRKKYLYQNVPVRQNSKYIDVVSSLFSDYYFSFSKSFDEVDFFVKNNSYKASVLLLLGIISAIFFSRSFFVFGFITSALSVIFFGAILFEWVAFKAVLRDIKENQIF